MQRRRRTGWLWAAGLLMASGWGCDGGGANPASPASGGSRAEATVTGKVTVQGKTATKGRVVFEPLDSRDMPTATNGGDISKDGTYKVKTLSGKNSMNVSGTSDPGYNRKDVELKPGDNLMDLSLPFDQ